MKLEFQNASRTCERTIDWQNYLEKNFSYCRQAIDQAAMRGMQECLFAIKRDANPDKVKDVTKSIDTALKKAGYLVSWGTLKFGPIEYFCARIVWSEALDG